MELWLYVKTCGCVQMPHDDAWSAMTALHKEAGIRFIVGVPLYKNKLQLAAAMMRKAQAALPRDALAGIELGNEPNYWPCTGTVRFTLNGGSAALMAQHSHCQESICMLGHEW